MISPRCEIGLALSAVCVLALAPLAPAQDKPAPPQAPQAPSQPGRIPSSLHPQPPQSALPGAKAAPYSPVDLNLDLRAALEDAKKQAQEKHGRVLVIWVADPAAMYSMSMFDVMNTADIRRCLGLEYAVVWADIGKGPHAAANRDLAKTLNAEVTATDVHPTLTVLTSAGKPAASRSAIDMVDPVRINTFTVPVVNEYLAEQAEPAPKAQTIAADAIAQAQSSKRAVLLWFGQYGDEWSEKFRAWLATPSAAGALGKRAVIAHVELLRDKGAFELLEKSGGLHVQSLPWFVVLNADGKSVGTSQPEKMPNIGFPTDEAENTAFFALLKAANPEWSEDDSKAIRQSLAAFLGRKAP